MFHLFDKAAFPIGVDMGGHALRLMQFRKAGKGEGGDSLALQAACHLELEAFPGSEVEKCAAALRHGMASTGFVGKQVVIALPAHLLQAKSIRLPQMPDSDLDQALGWEAKDRFGFEVGDPAAPAAEGQPSPGRLAWFRAGEVRRGQEVKDELHLFAVPGEPLQSYITAFTAAGLKILAIDLAPCAAYRSLARAVPTIGTGTTAILDVGHQGSQLMVACDGELVFYKHIEVGGRKISEAIAAKLGISPLEATQMRARLTQDAAAAQDAASLHQALRDAMRAPLEELSRELDMCLRYYVITFRGSRPDALRLIGRQASCPFLLDALGASLGLPIEEAQPLRGVQNLGDTARPDRSGTWAVAAGLSLYPTADRKEAAA